MAPTSDFAVPLPASVDTPTLVHGDCLDALALLPDASIDVVVTDPPAGIGFMAKPWDSFAGYVARTSRGGEVSEALALLRLAGWARGFVVFMVDVWSEVDRVLKPGGWCCAWALPKTADLAGLAMRAVGWDIHDSLLHLFGCLTDDTEILTDIGWVHGRNVGLARLALCYDVERGTYEWQPIERYVRFPFSGTAYRVHGDGVDHTVTPDHRCVDVGPDGGRFIDAAEASRQPPIRVPVPEGLRGLRSNVAGDDGRAVAPKQDVREAVRCRVDPSSADGSEDETEALRDLRRALLAQEPDAEPALLLAPLLRAMEGDGPRHPRATDGRRAEGCEDADTRVDRPRGRKTHGPEQPGVEGWGVFEASARQLRRAAVRSVPAGVAGDGEAGRVRDGAPVGAGAGARSPVDQAGGRAPHESRPAGQSPVEPGLVCEQRGPQAVRGARGTSTAVARVEPIAYEGFMWCVTVKTGAFVARANGLPFVTGNSGFPKSLDIGKALDKMAGAERDVTAPATPEANRWNGWGTALAPGHEHWLLARKPTRLTYARNVLEHGCGALNIDACRTPLDVACNLNAVQRCQTGNGGRTVTGNNPGHEQPTYDARGRWPTNVLLTEGGEHCPVAEIDRQSGILYPSGQARAGKPVTSTEGSWYGNLGGCTSSAGPGDSGGASRYFPRFRYQAKASDRRAGLRHDTNAHPTHKHPDLMRWLVRLLAAKAEHTGGEAAIVLDPFMGSGTTGVACVAERVRFIGIERDPVQPTDHDSYGVAKARIMAAIGSPEVAAEANASAPVGAQLGLL